MKEIITKLVEQSEQNKSRAYSILGAEPGPGLDIIFTPELPVAHFYKITVLTPAGLGFMRVLYNSQGRIAEGRDFTKMKKELADFGLSFHVDWSEVVEVIE